MRKRAMTLVGVVAIVAATLGYGNVSASGNVPGELCDYDLNTSGGHVGTASLEIKENSLEVKITNGQPDTLYTVWVDFRNRAEKAGGASTAVAMADDYPIPENGASVTSFGNGVARGVAPAFATVAGVTAGMGIDANGLITDANGNAKISIELDYNLLKAGDSPVAAEDRVNQGPNVVGGGWLREYELPIASGPSVQKVDANGVPVVVRATAQGITMVGHTDKVTHGHTPGLAGVEHFSAYSGDLPASCLP